MAHVIALGAALFRQWVWKNSAGWYAKRRGSDFDLRLRGRFYTALFRMAPLVSAESAKRSANPARKIAWLTSFMIYFFWRDLPIMLLHQKPLRTDNFIFEWVFVYSFYS